VGSNQVGLDGRNVASTKEKEAYTEFANEISNSCLEDLGVLGRIILKWLLKKQGGMVGLNLCGSGH
jgi:hypothetical protein